MYRVYDLEKREWAQDIYMSPFPSNQLYKLKKSLFGRKLISVDSSNYIIHKFVDLFDKDSNLVYEGDIIEAQISDDKTVTGIVTYATEWSAYIVLCFDPDEFYVLGDEICEFISVIGNVFDTPELVPETVTEEIVEE